MRTLLWIPVYDQIEELPGLLEELRSTSPSWDEILFVNNGSSDGSEKVIHGSGHPYLDVPANRGVGHGYRLAIEWALEREYDVLASMAGNGKMIPAEVPRIVDPILGGSYDYVTGSRYLAGGSSPNLPRFRRVAIPAVSRFAGWMVGTRLTDATCGFRAFRLEIMRRARFDWHAEWLDTYGFEYYIYAKVILAHSIRWTEVPVTMRYPERGRRYSKIRPFRDWYQMLRPWVRARLDAQGFAGAEPR